MTKQSDMDEKRGFIKGSIIGALIGAAAGVIGGILFAPQSGKETRAQIANMLKKAGRDLEKKIELVKSRIDDFSDVVGKDIVKLLDRAHELKSEIETFGKSLFDSTLSLDEHARKEAQRLIDESQKVLADLDRLLEKKAQESGDDKKTNEKETSKKVKKDVKK